MLFNLSPVFCFCDYSHFYPELVRYKLPDIFYLFIVIKTYSMLNGMNIFYFVILHSDYCLVYISIILRFHQITNLWIIK